LSVRRGIALEAPLRAAEYRRGAHAVAFNVSTKRREITRWKLDLTTRRVAATDSPFTRGPNRLFDFYNHRAIAPGLGLPRPPRQVFEGSDAGLPNLGAGEKPLAPMS